MPPWPNGKSTEGFLFVMDARGKDKAPIVHKSALWVPFNGKLAFNEDSPSTHRQQLLAGNPNLRSRGPLLADIPVDGPTMA